MEVLCGFIGFYYIGFLRMKVLKCFSMFSFCGECVLLEVVLVCFGVFWMFCSCLKDWIVRSLLFFSGWVVVFWFWFDLSCWVYDVFNGSLVDFKSCLALGWC